MLRNDDQPSSSDSITRPVLAGMAALLGVAVAVGLIMAGGVVMVTRMLGVGSDDSASTSVDSTRSLYMPEISDTETAEQPAPTSPDPDAGEAPSATPQPTIRLVANPTEARANTQITLTVIYPEGPEALLQVQRKGAAGWEDFPVSPINMNGRSQASTWIVSSLTGTYAYRVRDTDTGKSSKPVQITLR